MKITIKPGTLHGIIPAVPAKAYAHRILICAALADRPTLITGLFDSEDIVATAECLRACGVNITDVPEGRIITPPENYEKTSVLDCAESGSTLRFLLPVAAALGIKATFNGRGRLPDRPINELLKILSCGGVVSDKAKLPLTIDGKLDGNEFTVDGSVSSQFVTGMLLALAALGGRRKLTVEGKKVSGSYINITTDVMRKFGAEITEVPDGYIVSCPNRLVSPKRIAVEGDWSNTAFWLVAGVTGKEPVTVSGLNLSSVQGDIAIIEILRKMNADIVCHEDTVTAYPSRLLGRSIDCSDCPDLIPILSVAAAFAEGTTEFYGADRLRIKECDRLLATYNLLSNSKISCEIRPDTLLINGGNPENFNAECHSDHRMIMAAAILSLHNGGTIDNTDGVKKSYPHFFDDFKKSGGEYGVTL